MKISQDDYYKAKGLHLLATEAMREADKYRASLISLLGFEDVNDGGHIDNAVYGYKDFDEALKLENVTVETDK